MYNKFVRTHQMSWKVNYPYVHGALLPTPVLASEYLMWAPLILTFNLSPTNLSHTDLCTSFTLTWQPSNWQYLLLEDCYRHWVITKHVPLPQFVPPLPIQYCRYVHVHTYVWRANASQLRSCNKFVGYCGSTHPSHPWPPLPLQLQRYGPLKFGLPSSSQQIHL